MMKIQVGFLLILLFGFDTFCNAKKEKEPLTSAPTPNPTQFPSKSPSPAPTKAPPVAPKPPTMQPSPPEKETKEFLLDTFYVTFKSNDASFSIDKEALKKTTEAYFEAFLQIEDESLSRMLKSFDAVVEDVGPSRRRHYRRLARRLQESEAVAKVGGVVTFEDATITEEEVLDLQTEAFSRSAYADTLISLGGTSVNVSFDMPSAPIPPASQRVGGGGQGGKTAGTVIGSFAAIGVVAFAFIKYKKRIRLESKSREIYHSPEVIVEESSDGGIETFEATSPMFSIQDTVKLDDSESKIFEMPSATRVRNFPKHSGISISGHDDFDTYSLDGSTALGQKPNPGDKMLGQVLAMSNYTPQSDISFLNKDASTGRPAHVIRIGSQDDSNTTYTFDPEIDSPSVLGSSLASTSMMSENFTAHGRSLTISNKENSPKRESTEDEDYTSGIEITINKKSNDELESIDTTDDGWDNVAPLVQKNGEANITLPTTDANLRTPTRKLEFQDRAVERLGVQIVETEQANVSRPIHVKRINKAGIGVKWTQVQRVEKHHKVTIITEASNPSLVRSELPTQAAGSKRYYEVQDASKDRSLLEDNSSHDDDSYSSYFSSDDEGDDISKLLKGVTNQTSQAGFNPTSKKYQQKSGRNNSSGISKKTGVQNAFPPIRTPVQQRTSPRSPPSSGNSRGSAAISPFKQQEVNETIKSRGISTTNYAANARRNRMARNAATINSSRHAREDGTGKESISNQVATLRRARLQQRSR